MINSLIDKYGQTITIDGLERKAYNDSTKINRFRKLNKISSFLEIRILFTKEEIAENAVCVLNAQEYLYLETLDIAVVFGKNVYYETALFKNEFVNDIKLYKQSLNMNGCNLPSVNSTEYSSHKAIIRTKKANDYINYSMQGNKVITHEIVIFYYDGVRATDLVEWGSRRFEIINMENIDEESKFLVLNVIEVLNA